MITALPWIKNGDVGLFIVFAILMSNWEEDNELTVPYAKRPDFNLCVHEFTHSPDKQLQFVYVFIKWAQTLN